MKNVIKVTDTEYAVNENLVSLVPEVLKNGNEKLDKYVKTWSMTPIRTCLNCDECKTSCYAMKSYNMYPNVKECWDRHATIAETNLDLMIDLVLKHMSRFRKITALRLHASGDFFNQEYVDAWTIICYVINREFPGLPVYTYSKVFDLLNLDGLMSLPNVNIVNSVTPLGKNYGSVEYVTRLKKEYGYTICPVTLQNNSKKPIKTKIICGKHCKICFSRPKVAFIQH